MNKGQIQLGALIISAVTTIGSVGVAWIMGGVSGEKRAAAIELSLTEKINKESSERSNTDTLLRQQFQTIDDKLNAIISGLDIKYQLPKVEIMKTSEERKAANAPLISGVQSDGNPQNEQ